MNWKGGAYRNIEIDLSQERGWYMSANKTEHAIGRESKASGGVAKVV